jgi:hypothetical protein
LYYSQRLIKGGYDPLLIARRLVVHASEDVGLADPQALVVATSALTAYQNLGSPEGLIPLTQAIIYVCEAPKSNSVVMALHKATEAVEIVKDDNVPSHLINPAYLSKEGKEKSAEYKYPHNYGGYVEQQYLPDKLVGEVFYEPTDNGFEQEIKESSYLVTQAEIKDEVLLKIGEICQQSGTKIIFDPSPKREITKEFLEKVWLFTPNETEYENLFTQIVPQRAIITHGSKSVELIEGGEKTTFPVGEVVVRNTTGAGDVFNGALCYALANDETLSQAIKFAIKASAYKVQSLYVMDGIPTLEDVQ